MEGTPLDSESDKDKKKSKKRDSERLGSVATGKRSERTSREVPKAEKPEERWAKPKESELKPPKSSRLVIEAEPVAESNAPDDKLSREEKSVIAAEILSAEPPAEDPAVEYWRNLITEEGEEPDSAEQIVLDMLGAEAEPQPAEAEAGEPETEEVAEDQPQDFTGEVLLNRQPDADEEMPPVALTPTPVAASRSGGGHYGPGGPPPIGAVLTPPGPPFGPTGQVLGGMYGGPPVSPNLAPTAASQTSDVERLDDGNAAGAALLGGIIGYLIGRRRGRIKTEKKLLPIQKKLETQVNDLQWELRAKEAKIRKVAAEQVQLKGPVLLESFPKAKSPEREAAVRHKAPEAHLLHGEKPAPEHIGKMLVSAEAVPGTRRSEKSGQESAPKPETQRTVELPPNKRIETLNHVELLSLSEKIVVGGSTLRQVYETHLVGERGLRRLVTEYLRGGDLQKALRHEIVEHEIDFERDPVLRDMASQSDSPLSKSSGTRPTTALHELLEKASSSLPVDEEAAYFKTLAEQERGQLQQQQKHQRLVDISLFSTIAVLLAMVIVLYLTRR